MKQQKTFNIDIAQFGDMINSAYEHAKSVMNIIKVFKFNELDEYRKILDEATKDYSSLRVEKICSEDYLENHSAKLGAKELALKEIINEIEEYRQNLGEYIVELYNKSDKEMREIEKKTGVENKLKLMEVIDDDNELINLLAATKRQFEDILYEMNSKPVKASKDKNAVFTFKVHRPELISSIDGTCSVLNADEPEALQLQC